MTKQRPVAIKAYTFEEIIAEAQRREEEEARKVAAMSAPELAAYRKEQAQNAKAAEEILAKLRGPGFMELNIPKARK